MSDTPAILGGTPVFTDPFHITKPTLPSARTLVSGLESMLESCMITNARYVRQFENRVAGCLGVEHAVALGSCTSGLILALKALGCTGEIILPSFTFYATGHAVLWNNLTPVFADCEPETYNVDPAAVEAAITPRTSGILVVHIFGNPADIDALTAIANKHNLALIYDAAHGFGSQYKGIDVGSQTDASCFSLSPTKLITAGEGGVLTTEDAQLAKKIRMARNYGDPGTYDCEILGLNARMPEFSALLGMACLDNLEQNVHVRNRLAAIYTERLGQLPGVRFQRIEPDNRSSRKDFSLLIDPNNFGLDRDTLCDALLKENIVTKKYFHPPLHEQRLFRRFCHSASNLSNTAAISSNILSLPLFSHMSEDDLDKICCAIERLHSNAANIMTTQER